MQPYLFLNIITNKISVMRKWNNLLFPESLNLNMSNLPVLGSWCQLSTTFSLHPPESWISSDPNESWANNL